MPKPPEAGKCWRTNRLIETSILPPHHRGLALRTPEISLSDGWGLETFLFGPGRGLKAWGLRFRALGSGFRGWRGRGGGGRGGGGWGSRGLL